MKIVNKSGTAPKRKTVVGLPSQILGENSYNRGYSPTWYQNNDLAGYSDTPKPVNCKNFQANHKLTADDPDSRFWGSNSKDIRKATKDTIRGVDVW